MSSYQDAPDSRPDYTYPPIAFDPEERCRAPAGPVWAGRKAVLLAGTVAAVAVLILAGRTPEPVVAPVATPVTVATAPAPSVPIVATVAPAPIPEVPAVPKVTATVRLGRVDLPPRRPESPTVTVSTRNLALLSTRDAPPVLAGPSPLPRPAVRLAETARIATPALDAGRPLHRPDTGAAVRAAVQATTRASEGRPLPRPGSAPAPVVVASLSPAPAEMALAAAIAAPRARPEAAVVAKRAAAPAPVAAPRIAKPAKAVATPAPKVVRGSAPPPAARKPVAPVTLAKVTSQSPMRVVPVSPAPKQAVRAAPAPVRVAALAPAKTPVAVQAAPRKKVVAKPAPTPQRTTARKPAPTTERAGLSRGNVSLIGVFSGDGGRHALLLMPDGSIERVRPGDRIRGAQVAAIDSESVRLSGSGRDTLLRLPD